eukprot:TRINITY_DN2119_c0_g1_i3.p1 TRINITY_DN2119_c0_g1~~TRINITY_DN2119_c0_g1_i3.p1  ORF type:complete len:735 (+),score=130.92 TRINITY_DN2119_c0_g1_i3:174-2378(+)
MEQHSSKPKTPRGRGKGAEGSGKSWEQASNWTAESNEVVYLKENVSVHPTPYGSERITGRLRLIRQGHSLFMTWIPYSQGSLAEEDRNLYTIRAVSVSEIRSIRRHTPALGWQYIIIVLTSGIAFPPLYFHNGGVREFLSVLREHALLVRSAEDANVYLVNDIQDPLQRSLSSLDLSEAIPRTSLSSPRNPVVGSRLLSSFSANLPEADRVDGENRGAISVDENSYSGGVGGGGGEEARAEHCAGLEESLSFMHHSNHNAGSHAQVALRDASIQILEKFSKVTKFARETTAQLFGGPGGGPLAGGGPGADSLVPVHPANRSSAAWSTGLTSQSMMVLPSERFDGERATFHGRSPRVRRPSSDSAVDAVSQGINEEASTSVGSFELVDGSQEESPALVWAKPRPPPLGQEEWTSFMDADGRISDPKALRKRVFYGGVEPSIRKEVWKFLLGHFSWDSTYVEREELQEAKREEYQVLKSQWQTVSDAQAKRFAKFRERRSRVEKDVVRTDRSIPFYEGENNHNVALLRNILITYSFYNFDLGYCQGMSDLLSPILYIMGDEADGFWCFTALMENMASNFHRDQNGMHSQLLSLSKLVLLLDQPLHDYFRQVDCLNYFFCFRWILIHFKREFEYDDVLRLWEVLWSRHISDHFHLYVCVAILKRHRRKIMDEQMEFDTLLKFINELSGRIDLESTLRDAEALCRVAGDAGVAAMPPNPQLLVDDLSSSDLPFSFSRN